MQNIVKSQHEETCVVLDVSEDEMESRAVMIPPNRAPVVSQHSRTWLATASLATTVLG